MNRLKIGLAGCLGRMGKELIKAIHNDSDTEFVGGFEHPDNADVGKTFEQILGLKIDKVVLDNSLTIE